jgi:hypothetical protein
MNVNMTEFQRVNGGTDDLLPLYVEPKIIGKRTIFLYSLGILSFFITCILIFSFYKSAKFLK